jgi:hypothetical protein
LAAASSRARLSRSLQAHEQPNHEEEEEKEADKEEGWGTINEEPGYVNSQACLSHVRGVCPAHVDRQDKTRADEYKRCPSLVTWRQ